MVKVQALAFGFDRLVALLLGYEDIREIIPFPKAQNASEPMSKCPSEADAASLDELGLAIKPQKKEN